MFTGIIEEVSRVDKIVKGSTLTKLGISSIKIWPQAKISNSIAVNGVCLTLVDKLKGLLFFEAVRSTFQKTNLKRLRTGDLVNLEPALKIGDRLGGHFVLGHVDAEVKLIRKINRGNSWQLEADLPSSFRRFIVENGSVALEGISLTVKKVLRHSFSLDIIPFTYDNTNLKYKKIGDWLNVEFDYLLKRGVAQLG